MNKTTVLIFTMISLSLFGGSAYADTDFSNCGFGMCFNHIGILQTGGSNWHVEIHLPQNGATVINGVFSPDNFTALEQNPAIMYVNYYQTGEKPNLNYCPVALHIIENQDGYFYKIQNFTHLVYPNYCIKESGLTPFPIPEFNNTSGMITFIGIMFSIIICSAVTLWKKLP